MILIFSCSNNLEEGKYYSLSTIKKHARNGQMVHSNGLVTERIEKRIFLVEDDDVSLILNLSDYKKESKYLGKNSKVVFSGTYRKKAFQKPEIKVLSLQKVEEFK
ncbi:MAG: hypothetical protein HC906_01115 [Bacteroidales bacterium]|nr:hypothetical protein [Bacteroidales bacterium]